MENFFAIPLVILFISLHIRIERRLTIIETKLDLLNGNGEEKKCLTQK